MLVLQWPSSSASAVNDFDLLISLEDAIEESLGNLGIVDGHDIGSGEMNIFIFAQDPVLAFERVKSIPTISRHLSNLKAGYREVGKDEFQPLYPEGLDRFTFV
jgi:hypothetical protein